jgi:hypothetical protein
MAPIPLFTDGIEAGLVVSMQLSVRIFSLTVKPLYIEYEIYFTVCQRPLNLLILRSLRVMEHLPGIPSPLKYTFVGKKQVFCSFLLFFAL